MNANDLVRISRTEGLEALIGRVHLSTTDCTIVSELSTSLDLDGICLLPTKLIRFFDRVFPKADFYRAAVSAWGDCPRPALLQTLSCNLADDLLLLANNKETVAIHLEVDDPEIAYVGTIESVTATEVSLQRISSRGKRIPESLCIDLTTITKVEVGTRYLFAVGHAARVFASN